MNHTLQKLHADFAALCNEYVRLFCLKHEYHYDPDCWVGSEVGGIAAIGDYFVDLRTIIVDLEEEAPEEEFLRWYDYTLQADDLGITVPNYHSWLHGCPRIPQERLDYLRNLKLQLIEETDRVKQELKANSESPAV